MTRDDTPTDRLERAIKKVTSGEHRMPCDECTERVQRLEDKVYDHDKRLADGDVGFAQLRKDVAYLAEKVGALTTAAWWLIGVLVLGVLGAAGSALIWVIAHMGKGP